MCNGKRVTDKEEIKRNFSSIKRENGCFDIRDDLTGFLSKNHPAIYNGY